MKKTEAWRSQETFQCHPANNFNPGSLNPEPIVLAALNYCAILSHTIPD